MTYEECINRRWPHENMTRYTTGFYCDDCGNFYPKESKEYALHEGKENPLHITFAIHNKITDMYRSEGEVETKKYLRYKRRMNKISDYYHQLRFSPKENKWILPQGKGESPLDELKRGLEKLFKKRITHE